MVHTCHIQYDFYQESAVENQEQRHEENCDSFYINVDETPDSIKEFQVRRKVDAKEKVFQVLPVAEAGEATHANTFKQISRRLYEATLDKETYQFQIPLEDLTSSINHPGNNWSSITKFPEGYILGDRKGSIHLFDRYWQLQKIMEGAHVDEITSLQCFISGTVLLSASDDMQIKIWSLLDWSNPRTFVGHTASVTDTALIGRGRNFVSSGLDGCIKLWECGSGKNIHTMARKENPYDGINSIRLLDELTQKNVGSQQDVSNTHDLEYETEGKQVLAAHESGVITLHDLYTKREQLQLPNEFMSACNAVVNNSKKSNYSIFAGYEDGIIAQWDIRFPKHSLSHMQLEGTLNPVNTISWSSTKSSNDLYVSAGIDTSIKIPLGSDNMLPQPSDNQQITRFLVSDDYQISQYLIMDPVDTPKTYKRSAEEAVIAVGNRGFVSVY